MGGRREKLADEACGMDEREDMLVAVLVEADDLENSADEGRAQRIVVTCLERGFAALETAVMAESRKLPALALVQRGAGGAIADGAGRAGKRFAAHRRGLSKRPAKATARRADVWRFGRGPTLVSLALVKLFEQAAAIARSGNPADAVAFIEEAAKRGDPEGNVIVAHWLLYGSDRPRDAAAARRHLEVAGDQGSAQARRILAHLVANGTGGEADQEKALGLLRKASAGDTVAAEELALLANVEARGDLDNLRRETLSGDPHVEIVRNLLNAEECAYLMRRAEPLLKPSFVDDGKSGIGRPDSIRTSHGAAFVPHEEDLVVQAINRRIAAATDTAIANAEALYVMRYSPGQEYKPHFDALPGLANQREWTAIAYLNDDYEGGATVFPLLDLSIRCNPGDLLIFRNSDGDGDPDPRMRHAGEPVTSGAKWIATRWIRHGPHDPYDRG